MPGVRFVVGGRKELGMLRMGLASMAAVNEGWTEDGRLGRTTVRMWFLMPPTEGAAVGVCSGISMSARVSWVPIW